MTTSFRRIVSQFGLYVNKEFGLSKKSHDIYLTTNVDLFWSKSEEEGAVVALAPSFAFLDLGKFFEKTKFNTLWILMDITERNEVVHLLVRHDREIDRIRIKENTRRAAISARQWMNLLRENERRRGRYEGLRARAVILMERMYREGSIAIDTDSFVDVYNEVFRPLENDTDRKKYKGKCVVIKDVLIRALQLSTLKIPPLYLLEKKSGELDIEKIMKVRHSNTCKRQKREAGDRGQKTDKGEK